QELPVPILGIRLTEPLSPRWGFMAGVAGGGLPRVDSLRQEGGTVYLEQWHADAEVRVAYALTATLQATVGYHFTYFFQLEKSHEDNNRFELIDNGVQVGLRAGFDRRTTLPDTGCQGTTGRGTARVPRRAAPRGSVHGSREGLERWSPRLFSEGRCRGVSWAPPGGRRALRSARWITGRRKPENLAPAPALAVTVSADVLRRRGARKRRPGNMRPA